MRYMLLICGEEEAHKAMEADGSFQAGCHAWADELRRRGMLVTTEGLRPPGDATTVRVRGDQVLLTDGPFADTKEVFAGWYVIEADDIDAAIEIASRCPAARFGGSVEVRPVLEPRL
jgi:hypothetical protein